MKSSTKKRVLEIAKKFKIFGNPIKLEHAKSGKINLTYIVSCMYKGKLIKYTLQKVNKNIFLKPEETINNIAKICNYYRKQKTKDEMFLELVSTRSEEEYLVDKDCIWRCYKYINGNSILEEKETNFFGAGYIIGNFHSAFAEFSVDELEITIPNFHNIEKRLESYDCAVLECNSDRLYKASKVCSTIRIKRAFATKMLQKINNYNLPLRVVHNDTSLENMLFDLSTKDPLCLIDLDTVMQGYVVYDFGEGIRDCLSRFTDISQDSIFNFINGYFSVATKLISENEVECMYEGIWLIAFELSVRFITDYLQNDVYFGADIEGRNLSNALKQLEIINLLEKNEKLYREMIIGSFQKYNCLI